MLFRSLQPPNSNPSSFARRRCVLAATPRQILSIACDTHTGPAGGPRHPHRYCQRWKTPPLSSARRRRVPAATLRQIPSTAYDTHTSIASIGSFPPLPAGNPPQRWSLPSELRRLWGNGVCPLPNEVRLLPIQLMIFGIVWIRLVKRL